MRDKLTGEAAVLISCVREFFALNKPSDEPSPVPAEVDWPRFVRLVRDHHVIGPVLGGVLRHQPSDMPDSALAELKAAHAANARRSLFLTAQLTHVLQLLDSAGIPAISFKGPVLSMEAYGDPAMRGSGDLDLLIHRTDMMPARNLLTSRGFMPIFPTSTKVETEYLNGLSGERLTRYVNSHSEHHLMHPDGHINVDLHWDITLRQFGMPLDTRRLWNNCRMVRLANESVRTPGVEDLLLILCINAAKDCWSRFDRVCDVAALIQRKPDINFESLVDAARKIGAGRIVLVTLQLAKELIGLPLGDLVSQKITADKACSRLAAIFIDKMFRDSRSHRLSETIVQLRVRDQLLSRMRYVMGQCYPTVGDWSALPLPGALGILYFAIRPFRLLFQNEGKSRN